MLIKSLICRNLTVINCEVLALLQRFSSLQLTVIKICYQVFVHIKREFKHLNVRHFHTTVVTKEKNRSAKQAEKKCHSSPYAVSQTTKTYLRYFN